MKAMKEKIKVFGGFLVVIFILSVIGMIWFDLMLYLKIALTTLVLIILTYIIEKAAEK